MFTGRLLLGAAHVMSDEEAKPRFSSRPEAPWAMWAGIAGGLAATLLSVKAILGSGSSTSAIGFIFVPFIAIVAMVPSALWGLAAGCVWLSLRGVQRYAPAMLVAAWVLALAGPAVIGWEIGHGLLLERAVKEVRSMNVRALDAAFERSSWSRDKFYLGALAGRNDASPELLDRIAALDDPALYEAMGSLWDVMGDNRKGIAVMRLVANHPNARGDLLARLADGSHVDTLRHELARNPNTPMRVLARWFESDDYLVEWGLALNPNTPPAVMERLSKSTNIYTRFNLTYNKATPVVILERLAQDPDELLARNARQALERRR
jgi:hypothetical protein